MDTPLPPSEPLAAPGTGIANLPNQRHKIVAKNGANFTLMVCGTYHFKERERERVYVCVWIVF